MRSLIPPLLVALAVAANATTIAPPADPVDEADVWWDGPTLGRLTRSVVRLRPAGRGLLIDDASAGVAPMAAGVVLRSGYDGRKQNATRAAGNATTTTSPLPTFIVTTWRAVNPGFTTYTVDTADGAVASATLVHYDLGRPLAVLALDGGAAPPEAGVDVNAGLDGLQVGDPTLGIGLLGEGEDGSPPPSTPGPTPPQAWVAFTGYVQDAAAPLPRAEGVPSPIRNVRCLISRALLARPRLGAGGGVFDASGRLVGLDLEDDLAVAGVSGFRPETHSLPAAYVAAAVREAAAVWRSRAVPSPPSPPLVIHRGDLGVTWHAVPVGTAVANYRMPAALAPMVRVPGFDGPDGTGGVPRVLVAGSVDAGAPSAGIIHPGDVLISVDDSPPIGDNFLALDARLTAALRLGAASPTASLLVSRHGTPLTLTPPVADLAARRTSRVATFGGCTFQDVSVAAARRYQVPAGVLLSTCEGATGVPAGAGGGGRRAGVEAAADADAGGPVPPSPLLIMLGRSADMQAPPLPVLITGVGGTPVASLAEFVDAARGAVAAARASPAASPRPGALLPVQFAFTGIHVGCSRGFSMVDGAALPGDAADVVVYELDARGAWVKAAQGAPPAPAARPAPDAVESTDADLPAVPADVVRRTPPRVGGRSARPRPDDRDDGGGPLLARRPGSAPGWPSLGPGRKGGSIAGVVGGSEVDASSSSPSSFASLVSLAARVLGKRTMQSSGVWSQPRIAAMKRAVVSITMHEAAPLENYGASPSSAGSGFLVDGDRGIIATNAHVAGAFAGGWEVTFFDGTVAEARSLWYSPQQDIAFLRVDPAAIPFPDAAVTLASWTSFPADDVDAPSQFSPVMAVGNPARFPFTAMQGVYVGVSYRTNEAIGGTRERNVLNWKALMQSAGGASGSPVFNAAGAVVGALFAGGATSDPRFAGGTWRTEAMMVAADYVSDALGDGLADGRWPVRGGCGLELDLVPLPTARAFYGLKKEEAAALAVAGAVAGGPASPTGGPPAPLRPRDRVIVVAGVEPGAPTKAAVSAVVRPGDILWAVDGALLGGDLRAFERALHARVNGSVGVTLVRGGAVVNATLPVYDLTADRVTRYATWAGGIFHDVSDRTRYVYRIPYSPTPGVFLSSATDPSPWVRFSQQEARFQFKSVVTALDGTPVPNLDAFVRAACAVQAKADNNASTSAVPGSLVVRNVQDDGAPGGDAYATWWAPGMEGVRVFAWDARELVWRQERGDPCLVVGEGGR